MCLFENFRQKLHLETTGGKTTGIGCSIGKGREDHWGRKRHSGRDKAVGESLCAMQPRVPGRLGHARSEARLHARSEATPHARSEATRTQGVRPHRTQGVRHTLHARSEAMGPGWRAPPLQPGQHSWHILSARIRVGTGTGLHKGVLQEWEVRGWLCWW